MTRVLLVAALVVGPALSAPGEEKRVDSRIASVAMFKNGLVVVKRTVKVPGPGTYLVSDVPEPVHGTFWIESDVKVEARFSPREMEVDLRTRHGINFQEELAGREVVIHFRDGKIPPATGRVIRLEPASGEEAWDRTYQERTYWRSPQGPSQGRFLILETEKGRVYVDSSMIAYAQVEGTKGRVLERRPVLLLEVADGKEGPAVIGMSYLAKGMAWAPSYRVDLSDPEELTLEQKAVIKNELETIESTEMHLISGFPSVQFSHVTSPLSLRTTWATFFQELSQDVRTGGGLAAATQQRAILSNRAVPDRGPDLSAIPMGEGPDIHYQPIGRRSLKEGESLALGVTTARAPYERLVEWIVPEKRTSAGRHVSDPEKYRDAAWDAVRFKNPLPFPMTTGPAMVVGDGRFHGQRMSYWVNKGEEATIHITKALSIRTRSVEHEEPGEREVTYVAGKGYQKAVVKGELHLSNHRDESITVLIRCRFSGELLESEGDPKSVLLEEGAWSVNKRNELTWELTFAPGEERSLSYRYSLLVNR